MINDLDETLRQLLVQKVPLDLAEVGISFEAPNREWAASQSRPIVNLYLYDIRENHELRAYDWTVESKPNRTVTRKKAPFRADLSYLVTAWTKDAGDEHGLLGHLLMTLMRYPILPEELFQGTLKKLEYPVHASAAQPDGLFKNPADFWTSLDNQLKPSINYVVTLPMDLDIAFTAPMVLTKIIGVGGKEGGEREEIVQVAGTVRKKGKPEGIAQATVLVKETGMSAETDAAGRYTFARIQRGNYTLRVSAPGQPTKEARLSVPSDNYNLEL